MEPMKINVTYLKSIDACEEGLTEFRLTFPRGLTVKPGARLPKRTAERLSFLVRHFYWFIGHQTDKQRRAYHTYWTSAWAEYNRNGRDDKAWAEYNRARVHALWRALGGGAP